MEKLRQEVLTHPDQSFVTYVLDGLQNGFRVGFNPASVSLKSATQNMPSASLQPSVIDDYLYTELAKGRVAGPFSSPPLPHLHISRFGVIPKKHQPGKWRLILDLSSLDGHSVNDGIRKDPFTVQYMKVDDIIDGIMSLGRGTLLAKFDVESAYRIIPIHPNDRYLLGMQWQGNYFVDMALPFGLHSAPSIFSSVADLVESVLKKQYDVSFLLHYLDDFHTLGPPDSQTCKRNLDTCIQQFQNWGIPLHTDKLEGPFTFLTVLGIELDSLLLQACLPQEKFDRIHTHGLLVTKTSLHTEGAGAFNWQFSTCSKVVPSGHTFLHHMINLLSAFCREDHPIRLNREFHLNLSWWLEFFQSWNGYSFLLSPHWAPIPDLHVSSDALDMGLF